MVVVNSSPAGSASGITSKDTNALLIIIILIIAIIMSVLAHSARGPISPTCPKLFSFHSNPVSPHPGKFTDLFSLIMSSYPCRNTTAFTCVCVCRYVLCVEMGVYLQEVTRMTLYVCERICVPIMAVWIRVCLEHKYTYTFKRSQNIGISMFFYVSRAAKALVSVLKNTVGSSVTNALSSRLEKLQHIFDRTSQLLHLQ